MKQYPWKFRFVKEGIEWYQTEKTLGSSRYFYYFKIGLMNKKMRDAYIEFAEEDGWMRNTWGWPNFGLHKFWHDCPHAQLNLYFIVLYWSTQWTNMPKDYWDKKGENN